MVQIYWGFRLGFDVTCFMLITKYVCIEPHFFFRHKKMESVRWLQRRRQYIDNPYFSNPALWKLRYDAKYNPVGVGKAWADSSRIQYGKRNFSSSLLRIINYYLASTKAKALFKPFFHNITDSISRERHYLYLNFSFNFCVLLEIDKWKM